MRGSTPRAQPLHQDRTVAAKALAMGTGDSSIPRMICPARVGNAWLNPAPFVPESFPGSPVAIGGQRRGLIPAPRIAGRLLCKDTIMSGE